MKKNWRPLVVILLISFALGAGMLRRGHDWGDDFASYIMQAKSIVNGETRKFVERNAFTIFESSFHIGPIAYPWGYPLILTPAYIIKGVNPLALKMPGLILFACFLVCLYQLTKARLTQNESLLFTSLFAFNPMLLEFLDQILSDIPFLFFSTLALLFMARGDKQNLRNQAAIGGVIALAFFVRATGILLLGSFIAAQLLELWVDRNNRARVSQIVRGIFAACGAFGFLWLVYAAIFPGGEESYFAQYEAFRIETAQGFILAYFQAFGQFFGAGVLWDYLYGALFIFFLIGLWARRKEETVFLVFFFVWMAVLVTWPFWQGPRFIFPLLPIFVYFAFQGMKAVIQKLPKRYDQAGQSLFLGFWLIVTGFFLLTSSAGAYANLQSGRQINGPFDPFSFQVYEYIKEKTPPESVVVFFKPRAMRLFTDRDTFMSVECDRLPMGDYVVLSKKAENSQIPIDQIASCNLPLDKVFDNRRFIIYEIQK